MGYVVGEHYSIDDNTLLGMAKMLPAGARLKLFNVLCEAVEKRPLERIWLETGIRKTDLYRYLPKSKSRKGGLVPSPKTTVKIIRALLRCSRTETVVRILDQAESEMRNSYLTYFKWKRSLRRRNVIFNPWSPSEMDRINKSMY